MTQPRPAGGPAPDDGRFELSEQERKDIDRRSALRPVVLHEAIRKEGEEELQRPFSALAWSALAAGLSMGFSVVTEALIRSALPDTPWRPLLAKLGYPVGFLIAVLGRQQLFTENTLTVILPLLTRKDLVTLVGVLRLWGIVLAGNLVGGALFAWSIGATEVLDPAVQEAFGATARDAFEGSPGAHLVRAIYAGWLIALMVWMLPGAGTNRFPVIVTLTYVVGIAGLSHVVAGSTEVMYLVTTGGLGFWAFAGGYLLPTLVGNTIGGVALVAALNHAQVAAGDSRAR